MPRALVEGRFWRALSPNPADVGPPVCALTQTPVHEAATRQGPHPAQLADRSRTSVPVGLAVLGGLVLIEAVAARAGHLRRAPR